MAAVPDVLRKTMKEEMVYEALRQVGRIAHLPAYAEGSYWFSDECVEEIERKSLELQSDIIWRTVEMAHDTWRVQPEARNLLITEGCSTYLNAFVRLELAGPQVYNVWADHFYRLFARAGFKFDQKLDLPEFEPQMAQMEEIYFGQPLLLRSTFVVRRREFIQRRQIADYGDLLYYVSDIENDVFGAIRNPLTDTPWAAENVAPMIVQSMYNSDHSSSLQFRVARQIAAANGSSRPPLSW